MSLNVAAEMSVKLLEKTNRDDTNLLYFIGCLPGGVTPEQLMDMWQDENTNKCLERLQKQPFFEVGVDKIMLTPTMINYIDTNMDLASKQEYMHFICEFYLTVMQNCYKEVGKDAKNAADISPQKTLSMLDSSVSGSTRRLSLYQAVGQVSGGSGQTENEEENEKKFIRLMAAELRNIEACINFLIEASKVNKPNKKTKIGTNTGFNRTSNASSNEEAKSSQ